MYQCIIKCFLIGVITMLSFMEKLMLHVSQWHGFIPGIEAAQVQ